MATKTKNDVENQAVAVLPASEEVAVVLSNQMVTLIQEIVSIKTDTLRFLEATVSQVNRNAFEIGKRLCNLKESCQHGEWLAALAQVDYSEDTAQRMMRIYREYDPNVPTFQNLNYSQLVALFPVPVSERKEFIEENGVKNLSVSEIKKLIKQKEAAEKESSRLAKLLDTETDRRQKEQSAATEYRKQNQDLKKNLEGIKQDLFKSSGEIDKLKQDLEAAKSAPPVEVKVFEPSEQQIQEIHKKAYADAKADAEKEAAAAIDAEVEKRCAAFEEQIQRKTLEEDPGIIAVNLILGQIAPLLGLMSSELEKIDDPKITAKALRALESSLVDLFGDSWSNRHENQ